MILIEFLPALLIALVVVLLAVPPLASLGERLGWVYENKKAIRHVVMPPVPYMGGTAVLLGLVAAGTIANWPSEAWGLIVGILVVFGLGVVEDRMPVRRRFWIAGMAAGAAAAVIGGQHFITSTGQLFGPFAIPLSILAIPFSVAVVGVIAMGFRTIDRADGLCDGQALISTVALLIVALILSAGGAQGWPMPAFAVVAMSMLGALLGVSFYTLRRPGRRLAMVYLGSAGAMMLGLVVGWLWLQVHAGFGSDGIGIGGLMWIVAIPLTDLCFYAIRRVMTGRGWSASDKFRIYHWLKEQQFSVGQAVGITHAAACVTAVIGIAGWAIGLPDFFLFWGFWAAFAVYAIVALAFWTDNANTKVRMSDWRTTANAGATSEAIDVEAHTVLGAFDDTDVMHNPYRNGPIQKPQSDK
ncbi:MAG: MraY family glycosyltransferase [Burkholderiaceae bacterium]